MSRRLSPFVMSAALLTPACVLRACAAPPLEASGGNRNPPLVMAHDMSWFAAKPRSPDWGWHWTMDALDPDQSIAGRRRIASHDSPLIGPYDTADPDVIEYHRLPLRRSSDGPPEPLARRGLIARVLASGNPAAARRMLERAEAELSRNQAVRTP